jgi:hypothetical protein
LLSEGGSEPDAADVFGVDAYHCRFTHFSGCIPCIWQLL